MAKKSNVRTLELTHDQISHLKNALSIAEMHYTETLKQLKQTAFVRSNELDSKETEVVKFYHEKSCLFADLNTLLENGSLDV